MEIRGPGDHNYTNGFVKMLSSVVADPLDTQQLRVLRPPVFHGAPARLADLPPDPLGELLVGGQELHAVPALANLHDPLERVDPAGPLLLVADQPEDLVAVGAQVRSPQCHHAGGETVGDLPARRARARGCSRDRQGGVLLLVQVPRFLSPSPEGTKKGLDAMELPST